jgi:Animal haem peroxidase
MTEAHGGADLRGLSETGRSPLFQGRFGRMFRNLPPAQFGKTEEENKRNLERLGKRMIATFDKPKDGKDDEESGIPALYTYFGQFIDHNITFDPMSSLVKQNDPNALVDFRNPALDLDNVYGRGPSDQPYMYETPMTFLLGDKISGAHNSARDLPRNSRGRALIGDPRNDENSIVSQLQGLFLHFHNRLVSHHKGATFGQIQQLMRFHYQYVVLNDFLPRIVSAKVLEDLKTDGHYDKSKLKYFHWKNDPFMPVEFSVAAYRLGHSMVRPGYRLNDAPDSLLAIFPVRHFHGLTGFRPMGRNRAIDWGRFIDIDVRAYDGNHAIRKRRLQFAYRIDTSLVNPLGHLPHPQVVSDKPIVLAARNLLRGWRLGLPSGQDVARAMGLTPLADKDILIGKGVDDPGKTPNIVQAAGRAFAGNCPLWTYILAEAMHNMVSVEIPVKEKGTLITTPQLGPVGGRIVAEVFLGLMFGDDDSYLQLDPLWQPDAVKHGKTFTLKDIVRYAIGHGSSL